jgi:hypothetical protein
MAELSPAADGRYGTGEEGDGMQHGFWRINRKTSFDTALMSDLDIRHQRFIVGMKRLEKAASMDPGCNIEDIRQCISATIDKIRDLRKNADKSSVRKTLMRMKKGSLSAANNQRKRRRKEGKENRRTRGLRRPTSIIETEKGGKSRNGK